MSGSRLSWGGLSFPSEMLAPHSFIVGSTGSGKTVLLRMLMRSALLNWDGSLRARSLVYDGKRELYPLLRGMGLGKADVKILLPTDVRSTSWHIAKDVETPDDTVTLAKILAPDKANDHNPFFITATQSLLASTMWALHSARAHRWDMHDVVEAMRTPERLAAVLSVSSRSEGAFKAYFAEKEQAGGIRATIQNNVIHAYESLAVLSRRSKEPPISLREWVSTPRAPVLVLMPDEVSSSVQLLNRAMFHFAASLLESRPDVMTSGEGNESWLFLDEVRYATELPLLGALLAKGRTRGVHIAMASQSIEGLIDVYNENKTFDMLTNTSNLAVLRMARSPAAEKVAAMFGENEVLETDSSESKTKNFKSRLFPIFQLPESHSQTHTTSTRRATRKNVLVSTLTDFPPAGPKHGLHGIFSTPELGTWTGPIPWAVCEEELQGPSGDEAYIRRPSYEFLPFPDKAKST